MARSCFTLNVRRMNDPHEPCGAFEFDAPLTQRVQLDYLMKHIVHACVWLYDEHDKIVRDLRTEQQQQPAASMREKIKLAHMEEEENPMVKAIRIGNTLCLERKHAKGYVGINGAFFRDEKKNDYNVTGYEYQQLMEYWQSDLANKTVKNPPIVFDRNYVIYEEVNQNPPPKIKTTSNNYRRRRSRQRRWRKRRATKFNVTRGMPCTTLLFVSSAFSFPCTCGFGSVCLSPTTLCGMILRTRAPCSMRCFISIAPFAVTRMRRARPSVR